MNARALLVAPLLVASLLLPAACGEEGADSPDAVDPATSGAATEPTEPTEDPEDGEPRTVEGRLGDPLTLTGQPDYDASGNATPGETAEVTFTKVIGPFKGFDLPAGREMIGVRVTWKNVGDPPLDYPQPQATLTLVGGEKGKQTNLIMVGGESPCDNESVELTTGKSMNSCLAYEVPKGAKVESIEFAMSYGYGDTGIWTVP